MRWPRECRTDPEDESIVLIPLYSRRHGRLYAAVDAADAERVSAYRWHPLIKSNGVYAYAKVTQDGRRYTVFMHRLVLGITDPAVYGDHINHNTLDNRRENLRAVTPYQNAAHRRENHPTSRFRGVSWDRGAGKWRVDIKTAGRKRFLGRFDDELVAARVYDYAARVAYGSQAVCNFNDEAQPVDVGPV